MDTLYSTEFSRPEGRHGSIRSDDGLLDLKLALPQALGERPARLTWSNSLPEVCGML
jgi:organic hydroperoxide reductase OsmC/OhrA